MQDLSALQSGTVTVGVVAQTEIKRRQMVDGMNLRQIREVKWYKSFDDLFAAIEKSEVEWVFATYRDESGQTLSALMDKITADPALKNRICFSCMVKDADYGVIPELFDRGLMSWHENTDAPDEIAQAIYKLQKLIDQVRNPILFAFHFYRHYLKTKSDWELIIDTAENLLKKFPHELSLRLHQIEAYAKLGKQDVAKSMLEQFDFFDPELAAQVVQLRSQVLQESDNAHKLLAVQYQMRTALVVDPFPDSSTQIQTMLREFGFRNLQVFTNGDQAAQFVSRQSFDLAIIEWQCPGLGGPFLIQRIRQAGFMDVPIIVVTSVLDRADTQLVKDMGVAQVLKRPLKPQQLTMATAWTITQTRVPTEATSYERKVQEYLNKGDLEKAKGMFRTYVTFDTRDPLKEKYLKASILYQEKRYEEAKALLIETTHSSRGDNIHVAAMLARCLIQLGEFQTALALLKKVTALSPKNIERLCTLSQLALQTKDVKAAENCLAAAEALDPDSRQVVETQAKVATFTGNTQRAMELMKNLPNVEDVIVYMNNMAVTFVKTGEMQEGLKLYRNCLRVIPDTHTERQAIVAYNLGLALVRNEDMHEGAVFIKQAVDLGPSPVFARAESLYKRILEAKKVGATLRLKSGTNGQGGGEAYLGDLATEESIPEFQYFLLGLLQIPQSNQQAS